MHDWIGIRRDSAEGIARSMPISSFIQKKLEEAKKIRAIIKIEEVFWLTNNQMQRNA